MRGGGASCQQGHVVNSVDPFLHKENVKLLFSNCWNLKHFPQPESSFIFLLILEEIRIFLWALAPVPAVPSG